MTVSLTANTFGALDRVASRESGADENASGADDGSVNHARICSIVDVGWMVSGRSDSNMGPCSVVEVHRTFSELQCVSKALETPRSERTTTITRSASDGDAAAVKSKRLNRLTA
jgi:hypothetical protein